MAYLAGFLTLAVSNSVVCERGGSLDMGPSCRLKLPVFVAQQVFLHRDE